MSRFLIILIGYFIGALIQTSYWYSKAKKMDIRDHGSGNAGTTNAMRMMGKKAGFITAIGDVTKVFLADYICYLLFKNEMLTMTIFLYAGIGTVFGHIFPFYMKGRGGKGIATVAGVIISLWFLPTNAYIMTLVCAATFFIVLYTTRYAFMASLSMVTAFLIQFIIFAATSSLQISGVNTAEGIILVIIMTVITFVKHISNFIRFFVGFENKIGTK